MILITLFAAFNINAQNKDKETVKNEHSMIDMAEEKKATHTTHPDAQWYPDAGLGLFIHWGIYSVLGDGEWVGYSCIGALPLSKILISPGR